MAGKLLLSLYLPSCGARRGCNLTVFYGNTAVMPIAAPKRKRSLLPVLTILFVISYAMMTFLIIQQGAVIQSQRNMIKVLMRDSTELWAAKGKAAVDQAARAQAQNRVPSAQAPSAKTPSTQAQTPSSKAPSTQVQKQRSKAEPEFERPPAPAADLVDRRRSLNTI